MRPEKKANVVFQVRGGGTWNRVATVDMEKNGWFLVLAEMKPVGTGDSGGNSLLVQCC